MQNDPVRRKYRGLRARRLYPAGVKPPPPPKLELLGPSEPPKRDHLAQLRWDLNCALDYEEHPFGPYASQGSAVRAIIEYLQSVLPGSSFNDVEPLEVLLIILGDLNTGALRLAPSGGNRHLRLATDLKARCLVISELLQKGGLEKRAADNLVVQRIRTLAPRVGLRLEQVRHSDEKEPPALERWRKAERRDHHGGFAEGRNGLSDMVSLYLAMSRNFEGLAPEETMDKLLGLNPPMTLEYLSQPALRTLALA